MKQLGRATAVLGLVLACAAGPVPHTAQTGAARVALRAARVLDPSSGVMRADLVVLVEGSRIVQVLPASRYRARPSDRVIDLGDATLLPGLIDAHVHLTIGGPPRVAAAAILKAGFTTAADLGAVSQRVQAVRDSIAAFAIEGPRLLAAGVWIGVKGGVCEFGGIGKACVTGWPATAWQHPDSVELSVEVLTALADEAHRHGRRVVALRACVLCAVALGALSPGMMHGQAPAIRDTTPEAVVRAFVEAYNKHDLDAMFTFLAPDIVWLSVAGDSVTIEARGIGVLREQMASYFGRLTSARSELETIATLGPWVSARERAHWTAASGPRSQASLSVYEVRAGRVRRVWYYPVVR